MKLSIIIPVYNVENYIKGTLESIYNQKEDETTFEVIIVNDGTPDNSMLIVEEFKNNHSNLIIINQNNLGLSAARNVGVKNASGKYIWFVDSDDKINPNSISKILEHINQNVVDVSLFGYITINELTGAENIFLPIYRACGEKYYEKIVSGYLLCNNVEPWLSQKMVFNKIFFEERGMWFNEGIVHEDVEQGVRLLCEASKCYCSKELIYRYLLRSSGSITTTKNEKSLTSRINTIKIWEDYLQITTFNKHKKEIISHYIFYQIYYLLTDTLDVKKKFIEKYSINKCYIKNKAIRAFMDSIHFCNKGKLYRFFKLLTLKVS